MFVLNWLREFVTRVGGMISAPRSTLERLMAGRSRGGLLDLVLLALLHVVATRLADVVQRVLFAVDISGYDGLLLLGSFVAQAMFVPIVGAFLGAFVVSTGTSRPLLAPRDADHAPSTTAEVVPALDIASLCALPGVAFQTVAALAVRLGAPPQPKNAIAAAAAVWFIGLLFLARSMVKDRPTKVGT